MPGTMRTLHSVLFAGVLTAMGCTGSAQVHTTAEADYVAPQLIEVEPGVQVVADYDQPVFYSDGMYWRSEGGIWYSSRYHNHAWVRVQTPPVAVAHIERPEIYVHYHGHAEVRHDNDERRVDHDMNQVNHDQHEVNHDQNEMSHDRNEIRHDEATGHEHEAKHDEKELAHDQKEAAKDERKEMKDEKKAAKDERKEEKHEHKH